MPPEWSRYQRKICKPYKILREPISRYLIMLCNVNYPCELAIFLFCLFNYEILINFMMMCYQDGENALHWAAQDGHLKVCKFLFEKGVDLNVKNWVSYANDML
jgi:hypothetical protein